jgi:sulfatase maturation enzyme AslB (radical SAM superfamily)
VTVAEHRQLGDLVARDVVGDRLWFYTNYHCNLTCSYCLTGSSPRARRRQLDPAAIMRIADDAAAAGFACFGISGGEPFLNPWLPDLAIALARKLPLVLLTNGTLFTPRLLDRVARFAPLPIEVQISLDSADPIENDTMRGPDNHAKVVAAIPRLVERGITVRMATTIDDTGTERLPRLCELHRGLGVDDDHHIVRPIIARGRATTTGHGIPVGQPQLPPELTLTADGAFWSPFGATSADGRTLDTEMLLCRTIEPLRAPVDALVSAVEGRPPGEDASIGIR